MEQLGQEGVETNQRRVVIVSQESFYKELSKNEAEDARKGNFNFDHPGEFIGHSKHELIMVSFFLQQIKLYYACIYYWVLISSLATAFVSTL